MSTKLLIAFSDEDLEVIDWVKGEWGLPSRASAVRFGMRQLRRGGQQSDRAEPAGGGVAEAEAEEDDPLGLVTVEIPEGWVLVGECAKEAGISEARVENTALMFQKESGLRRLTDGRKVVKVAWWRARLERRGVE